MNISTKQDFSFDKNEFKQIQKNYKDVCRFIHTTEEWKRLSRLQYFPVFGQSISKITELIICHSLNNLGLSRIFQPTKKQPPLKWSQINRSIPIKLCTSKGFKPFAISENLLNSFLRTKAPEPFPKINCVVPNGLLIFPKNSFKAQTGTNVNFVLFTEFKKNESVVIGNQNILNDSVDSIRCIANTGDLADLSLSGLWFSIEEGDTIEKGKVGVTEIARNGELFTVDASQTDHTLAKCLTSVIVQTLLYLQSKNAQIERNPLKTIQRNKNNRNLLQVPIIGYNYKSQETTITKQEFIQEHGTHASPRPHWRSGHYRNQMFGSRNNPQHKLIWIEPVFVNVEN